MTEVLRNGKFSITLTSNVLTRGLRKRANNPRDSFFMSELEGLIGHDGVLTAQDVLSRIDTSVITDPFPYPQIFILSNYVLVCDSTKIYDYSSGSLVLAYTASQAGSTWKAIDFIEYIVMTNNDITVIRTATTGAFTENTSLPEASAICNYNNQVLIGGPGES